MIVYLYLSVRNIILFILGVFLLFGIILSNKDIVPFLAEKYAGEFGVTYSKVQGSFLFGVDVYDFSYGDFVRAKSLSLRYDFFSLLYFKPQISEFQSQSLYVDIDKLPVSDSNQSSTFMATLRVKKLLLKNTKINYDKKLYSFDFNATKLLFDKNLTIKEILLALHSSDADVLLDGAITSNLLKADTTISISDTIRTKYLDFLQTPPKTLKCKLQADMQNITLSTVLKSLKLKEKQELALQNLVVQLDYSLQEQKLSGDLSYALEYAQYALQTEQNLTFNLDGNYSSSIEAKVVKTPLPLAFENIHIKAFGDFKNVNINLNANKLHYEVQSEDYKHFIIQGGAKELSLSFLKELPKLLQEDSISFTNSATLDLSPLHLNTIAKVDSHYYTLDANADVFDGNISAYYLLKPKKETPLFQDLPIEQFSPIEGSYLANGINEKVQINANLLKLNLLKKGSDVQGNGKIASNNFHIATQLQKEKPLELDFNIQIASLKKTLKVLDFNEINLSDFSDIALDINNTIILNEPIVINSSLFIPKILYKADKQTRYLIGDIHAHTSVSDKQLTLKNYALKYKTDSIYSKKSSQICLQDNMEIFFQEFWFFDNLLVNGIYKTKTNSGEFSLKSKKFHYKDTSADINVGMDLNASFNPNSTKVEGRVTLLDGNVSYLPTSDYTISDPDIIMVDEKKNKKASNILLNVKIDSKGDILYLHENANIYFKPNIRVLKNNTKDVHLNGKMVITKGEINLSDKKFVFDKSELDFDGSIPVNPKLNLSLHYYTLDYTDILIDVTNTLEEPVFIFSSNPALSQNDIMSYILFGESADSMFNSSGNSSKTSLLLGTGIKKLLNTNSSIKIDTLNILTSEDGSVGYEIGSRINKNIRLVYKSDTVSSVILQYSLSKSTRVDVDVRETGQGVSFIYLKDFK